MWLCDSETFDIDMVDDEPQDGMVIEGYTVNICDTITEEFSDDEERNGSVLGENTWDSSTLAVEEETYSR